MVNLYLGRASTQNLIPNPSFEDITQCPDDQGQIYYAKPWFQPVFNYFDSTDFITSSSSDLFHECGQLSYFYPGVPINTFGNQMARTGKAYAGIGFWIRGGAREMIETPLIEPLKKDSIYCVSMYVVNKISKFEGYGTSTSNLHFLFTKDSLILPGYGYYTTPSVKNPDDNIISDTTNWTLIKGEYKAEGGERFLTIGSFYSDTNSTVSVLDSLTYAAYYFIDDVCVSILKNNSEEEEEEEITEALKVPNIFTPNGDGINDFWTVEFKNTSDYVIVLNRWGNRITTLNKEHPKWEGDCKSIPCTEGVYFYKAYLNGKYKDGFIQLVR